MNFQVTGDRVAYVITKKAKGAPAYEKAEDPIFVLDNDIAIDSTVRGLLVVCEGKIINFSL